MPLTDIDRKLLNDLLTGQSGTWKLFVDRFTSLILQVIQHTAHAHSLKLNADDVEDLCADTFAELLLRDMAERFSITPAQALALLAQADAPAPGDAAAWSPRAAAGE